MQKMLSGSGILSQKFWEKEKVNFWEKVFDLYMMYKLRLVGAQRAGWGNVKGGLNRPPLCMHSAAKIICK